MKSLFRRSHPSPQVGLLLASDRILLACVEPVPIFTSCAIHGPHDWSRAMGELFAQHGLPPPHVGALVNSTLALLSLVVSGDCIALMPEQIARGPLAAAHISIIPIRERGLPLEVGAIMRSNAMLSPVLRQLTAHLHRAAHHVQKI